MGRYTLIIDGGTVGSNPGIGVAAVIVKDESGRTVHTENEALGEGISNNQAEYRALLLGIAAAKRQGATCVTVLSDSRLVVNQVNKGWAIHNLTLRGLAREVWDQITEFKKFTLRWVPRAKVSEADELLNAVRPHVTPTRKEPQSFYDWLRQPVSLWYHLPDGRTLYNLTYYVRLADKAAPSIDLKIWRSLWDRNPDCWIMWRPWGKYPLSGQQVRWGLGDLEDGIQEPIMAPLRRIRSEFLDADYVGKWGGKLLILSSDVWEQVDESLADEPQDRD